MAYVEGLGPAWKGLLNGGEKSETVQAMGAGCVTQRPHPPVCMFVSTHVFIQGWGWLVRGQGM